MVWHDSLASTVRHSPMALCRTRTSISGRVRRAGRGRSGTGGMSHEATGMVPCVMSSDEHTMVTVRASAPFHSGAPEARMRRQASRGPMSSGATMPNTHAWLKGCRA